MERQKVIAARTALSRRAKEQDLLRLKSKLRALTRPVPQQYDENSSSSSSLETLCRAKPSIQNIWSSTFQLISRCELPLSAAKALYVQLTDISSNTKSFKEAEKELELHCPYRNDILKQPSVEHFNPLPFHYTLPWTPPTSDLHKPLGFYHQLITMSDLQQDALAVHPLRYPYFSLPLSNPLNPVHLSLRKRASPDHQTL